MGRKCQTFEKKQTGWMGLWWHPEYSGFSSTTFSMATLKEFKGPVKVYVRKNKFYEQGGNRPNYCFCIKDANAEIFAEVQVEEEKPRCRYDADNDCYYGNDGERLYTYSEVRRIIECAMADFEYGITDPGDIVF